MFPSNVYWAPYMMTKLVNSTDIGNNSDKANKFSILFLGQMADINKFVINTELLWKRSNLV